VTPRSDSWQRAYFAVSAILGEKLDDAAASLVVAGAAPTSRDEEFLVELRSPSRAVRAKAIARGLSEVALALDAARLA
jgi:hypothetical protein